MGDSVDDIETMFDWYHLDRFVGLLFHSYLLSFLTHSPFSLVLLNVAMQTIECWWDAGYYSMIQKLIMNNNLYIIHGGYSYCSCTFRESQTMPAVLRMNIPKNLASLSVSLRFPHWLGDSPRCFQLSDNCANGVLIPVIRDPSYSDGRLESPSRVWFSSEIDASKFTLHLLSDTTGSSQWLKYILLILRTRFLLPPSISAFHFP